MTSLSQHTLDNKPQDSRPKKAKEATKGCRTPSAVPQRTGKGRGLHSQPWRVKAKEDKAVAAKEMARGKEKARAKGRQQCLPRRPRSGSGRAFS